MSPTNVQRPVVVRASEAETLGTGPSTLQLLLDSSATRGALSAHRVYLVDGMNGANPHRHTRSSEVFFVLSGRVDVLSGDETLALAAGDMVVVPPETAHAFAASAGGDGELLVIITPGVERFEFFRELVRVLKGQGDLTTFLESQAQYDTFGEESATWQRYRSTPSDHRREVSGTAVGGDERT